MALEVCYHLPPNSIIMVLVWTSRREKIILNLGEIVGNPKWNPNIKFISSIVIKVDKNKQFRDNYKITIVFCLWPLECIVVECSFFDSSLLLNQVLQEQVSFTIWDNCWWPTVFSFQMFQLIFLHNCWWPASFPIFQVIIHKWI